MHKVQNNFRCKGINKTVIDLHTNYNTFLKKRVAVIFSINTLYVSLWDYINNRWFMYCSVVSSSSLSLTVCLASSTQELFYCPLKHNLATRKKVGLTDTPSPQNQ